MNATPAEEVEISAGIVRVLESTQKTSKGAMINHGTLKTWHGLLFAKAVPLSYYAGNFRGDNPNAYPCLYGIATIGGKNGMPPQFVAKAMRDWGSTIAIAHDNLELYLKNENRVERQVLAKLALIAQAVGEFIRIHPFVNGNGRVGRLIANHLCHRYDLPMPFVTPSKRPSDQDYGDAGKASMDGNHRPMMAYLLAAVNGAGQA